MLPAGVGQMDLVERLANGQTLGLEIGQPLWDRSPRGWRSFLGFGRPGLTCSVTSVATGWGADHGCCPAGRSDLPVLAIEPRIWVSAMTFCML